jgi:hypothetical protein
VARREITPNRLLRRFRPSPESVAAAAALQDPGPLLELQAERLPGVMSGRLLSVNVG